MRRTNLVFTRLDPAINPEAYQRAVATLGAALRRGAMRKLGIQTNARSEKPGSP